MGVSYEYEKGYQDAVTDARHAWQNGYMGTWLAGFSPATAAERAVRFTRTLKNLSADKLADGRAFREEGYDC